LLEVESGAYNLKINGVFKKMKRKYFFVILFLILAIFLSGCSGGIGTTPPVTPNQSLKASFTAVTTTAEVGPESVYFVVHFDASSSNGSIVSYAWNFKDSDPNLFSNTGNGKIIDHAFSFSGNYNVELTVIDNKGATDSITKIVTLFPDVPEFMEAIEELDTPEKIGNYMLEKFVYENHPPGCKDTYILWVDKTGRCSDFARFATIIANYHGYETYEIATNAYMPDGKYVSHTLGVYVEDGGYTYSSNQYYSGIIFNTFEEIVNDSFSSWNPMPVSTSYCVWNHDCERVEESPNY